MINFRNKYSLLNKTLVPTELGGKDEGKSSHFENW